MGPAEVAAWGLLGYLWGTFENLVCTLRELLVHSNACRWDAASPDFSVSLCYFHSCLVFGRRSSRRFLAGGGEACGSQNDCVQSYLLWCGHGCIFHWLAVLFCRTNTKLAYARSDSATNDFRNVADGKSHSMLRRKRWRD